MTILVCLSTFLAPLCYYPDQFSWSHFAYPHRLYPTRIQLRKSSSSTESTNPSQDFYAGFRGARGNRGCGFHGGRFNVPCQSLPPLLTQPAQMQPTSGGFNNSRGRFGPRNNWSRQWGTPCIANIADTNSSLQLCTTTSEAKGNHSQDVWYLDTAAAQHVFQLFLVPRLCSISLASHGLPAISFRGVF